MVRPGVVRGWSGLPVSHGCPGSLQEDEDRGFCCVVAETRQRNFCGDTRAGVAAAANDSIKTR